MWALFSDISQTQGKPLQRSSVQPRNAVRMWVSMNYYALSYHSSLGFKLQLLLGGILPAENGRKERLVERAQALATVIAEMVQVEKDTDTLQELLTLNDELLGYIKRIVSRATVLGTGAKRTS